MHNLLAHINAHVGYSSKTPIKNLFEFCFTKQSQTKRPDAWDRIKDMDLDTAFKKIAGNIFRKNPFHLDPQEKDDLIIDALNEVLSSPSAVKSYDVSQDFISFFGRIFQLKLISQMQEYTRRKTTEKDNFDDTNMTTEERMDLMGDTEDHGNDLDNYLQFKQLLQQLDKFLKKTPQGAKIAPMLPMLIEGYSSKEIAQEMGISPGAVSQYLSKLKDAIAEYAKQTKNALLLRLVEELAGQRKHADSETQPLLNLFTLYQKKRTHSQDTPIRQPSGEVSRIQLSTHVDPYSDSTRLSLLNGEDYVSEEEQQAQIDALIADLQASDDVLDLGDNRITTLRISR